MKDSIKQLSRKIKDIILTGNYEVVKYDNTVTDIIIDGIYNLKIWDFITFRIYFYDDSATELFGKYLEFDEDEQKVGKKILEEKRKLIKSDVKKELEEKIKKLKEELNNL